MRLAAFFLQRLGQAVLVMLVISFIGFAILDSLGDPLRELVGQSVSEEVRNELREELGLNDPFLEQYGRFLAGAIQGDLGDSYFYKDSALGVILGKFPATFELVLATALITGLIAAPAGVATAIWPNSFFSRFIMAFSILGVSVPVFLTGIFLIYIFAVELNWLSAFGRGQPVVLPWGWDTGLLTVDGLKRLILPAATLSSIMLPFFIRLIRAEMMETLRTEYVRFARAKGLSRWRVWFVHAFRNTLLPVVTVGGVQIGTLLAYTILTESVFQWPGMGFMFLEAVNRADTPLIVAYIIVVGLVFVTVNTIVDILYALIDPTVRLGEKR